MLGGLVHRLIGGGRRDFIRKPDVVIGGTDNPYMLRWWLIPRNPICNVYLHCFLRSDDDRALHSHPWLFNASLLLAGRYTEHTSRRKTVRRAGAIKLRFGPAFHRIELTHGPCWTLFITGPVVRVWGFACPQGWVSHHDYTATDAGGASISLGCGETT